MSLLSTLQKKLSAAFRPRRLDADMAEEMRAHISLQEEANRSSGMSAQEARQAALRQFGNVPSLQERCRDARGMTWLRDIWGDLQLAVRLLGKSPGYAFTVVVTLALGISTNTQIFGMANVFFLQPMNLPAADRLVLLAQKHPSTPTPFGFSFPDFRDLRERLGKVTDLIAYGLRPVNFSMPGKSPQRVWMEVVTPDAFGKMGVQAALGRVLLPTDGEEHNAGSVALVSHAFWQTELGGDPQVLGKPIVLNGKPFTVVGVTQEGFKGFQFALKMSLWVPSGAAPHLVPEGASVLEERGSPGFRLMGRLAPGATLESARAEFETVAANIAAEHPQLHKDQSVLIVPETRARPDISVSQITPILFVLFAGMVILVLSIACANVANLMLARGAARQREMALRSALGASRFRLMRQLLVESTVLAIVAGLVAWFLQDPMGSLLQRFTPKSDVPTSTDYVAGWSDVLFAVGISLATGLLAGALPALRGSRADLLTNLKQGHGSQSRPGKHRLRNMLVIGQVAMSLVVLIGGGLFLRSLGHAKSVPIGFSPDRLLTVSFDLGLQGYDENRGRNFIEQAVTGVSAIPQVEAATVVQHVPFSNMWLMHSVYPENPAPQLSDGTAQIATTKVESGFFKVLGIPVIKGRAFEMTDRPESPRVVVINEMMAQFCWPGQDPVGKRFRLHNPEGPWVEVIGVVPTGKYQMLGEQPRPYYYTPLSQDYSTPVSMVVRTRGDPASALQAVRDAISTLDPHLPLFQTQTMETHIRDSVFGLMPLRMGATMAGIQGGIGLFLAIMGLYAVVSYGVTQRTQEIGVRMALGASRDSVIRLVVKEGVRLTFIGLGAGALFAAALGFGLSKLLFGLSSFDPLVFGGVSILLLGTTLLACWLPARRAASINPMQALRAE